MYPLRQNLLIAVYDLALIALVLDARCELLSELEFLIDTSKQ
ncbi:MAG: hypothetical protein V3V10_09175 [Planctomycetota bacterium]